jgi:hypothetical protein
MAAPVHHELLAYLSDEFEDDDATALRDLAVELKGAHSWKFEPPYFVDDTDDSSGTQPEDEAIRTVGLILPLSLDGEDKDVPVKDLIVLVKALARLSRSRHLEFALELDETYVGDIQDGDPDDGIREGLLATWERTGDGARMPAGAQYQLVLQWPASLTNYDGMIEVEEFLIENLDHGEIDGHDAGQGETNIFIQTDDPEATYAALKGLLWRRAAWDGIRIAYRDVTRDKYWVLWPEGGLEGGFKVS